MKELVYPSTYHAMKAGPCRVGVCKHDGECELCEEYGTLRRYAARDVDRIHELRALVEGLLKASTVECASCDYDCGQNRENCIIREAEKYIKEGVTNGLHKECS